MNFLASINFNEMPDPKKGLNSPKNGALARTQARLHPLPGLPVIFTVHFFLFSLPSQP
jgi:hypothetical protein